MISAVIQGVRGLRLEAADRASIKAVNPWGFILFAHNVDTPDQLRALTSDLRDTLGRDAPVLVDQEGGRVQRLRAPHWTDYRAPIDDAKRGPRAIYLRYALIGAELAQVGIDVNCAPTLDLAFPQTHPFLRDRCLGNDASEVSMLGRAAADGLLSAGVLPVVKHMPGHGRATADSHKDLPQVDAPLKALMAEDVVPFRALRDLPLGMTAHVRYSAIDAQPATLSPAAIALIREDIGFQGLLMTDDLAMKALEGRVPDRARASLAAGCDIALHCHGDDAERRAVADACGPLSGPAARRAEEALAQRQPATDRDIEALAAEYAALG